MPASIHCPKCGSVKTMAVPDCTAFGCYLLTNPLRSVIHDGRERYLIVIEALAEAGRSPLVEIPARHAMCLPDWLGLVVTSRPDSAVQTPLQGLNPFVLDTRTEAKRADLRDYLCHQLAPQLQRRPDADRLIGQILAKSDVLLCIQNLLGFGRSSTPSVP